VELTPVASCGHGPPLLLHYKPRLPLQQHWQGCRKVSTFLIATRSKRKTFRCQDASTV
jgi:hypothetical protein